MTETKDSKAIRNLLWGGIITLIINLFLSYCQDKNKIEMEKIQFESTLIINAIDKGDIESSKKNIKFLIESGLISKTNQKIIPLLTDSTFSIVFPVKDTIKLEPQNKFEIGNTFLKSIYSAQVVDENNNPLKDVEIISNTYPNVKGSYYAKTLTDANGLFKIPLPESEKYTLSIQKDGYDGRNNIHYGNMIHPQKIRIHKKESFFKDIFH